MPLRTVFACLACATALPLRGRAQQPLTLQEAVALAKERGLDAQAARAARDAGRYRYQAFRARLLPQLSLGGLGLPTYTYNRSVVPVVQPDGSTLFRYQDQTNAGMSLTLSQKLPVTGGDLFVSSSLARVAITGTPGIQTWSSTPVVVGLQQDLLRPNVAGWDRREQAVRTELNERTYREAMEAVALGTTGRFFDMYAARVALDNAVKNAAVNDTLYRLNTGRFDVGKIGENDLLQSEPAPQAGLAYQNLLQQRQFAMSVQIPLWQWGAHAADVQAAEADRDGVASQSRARLAQTAHDAHYAALQLLRAARTVALLAKADTVAAKRFEVAYNRYVIGRITLDNLYIGQSEKDQALMQFVNGLRDYWGSYYRLRQVTLFDFVTGQPIR